MSRDSDERSLLGTVTGSLKRWLSAAREAVMAPWERHQVQPDVTAVYSTQPLWDAEVGTILTHLGRISLHAWSQATDVPPVSRHAFVMAELAMVQNLLVRVPDETAGLIFEKIIDVTNAGGDSAAVARAVDDVLTWTGSENWDSRAHVIAVTENTRAYGYGTLAAGMEQGRVTGRQLGKKWSDERDPRVRAEHRAVNGQVVPLGSPFYVAGIPMMYPADPSAPADLVCGCRCDLVIVDERQG